MLRRVQALEGEQPPARVDRRRVHTEAGEDRRAAVGDLDHAVRARPQRAGVAQPVVEGHADRAAEVGVARPRRHVRDRLGRGHPAREAVQERQQGVQAGVGEVVDRLAAVALDGHEARLAQPAQVVGEQRHGDAELLGQPGDRGRPGVPEPVDHAQAHRVGELLEERDARIVAHVSLRSRFSVP